MCGASLFAPSSAKPAGPVSVATPAPVATEVATGSAQVAEKPRPAPVEKPSISGPSFLGLSDPPSRSAPRTRASLSIDPHPPGRSLDYLLEEEEPHRHWGIGKILIILIALGLAIGFGYLRFKNQGLAWLKGVTKPTAAVAQNSTAPDTAAANPSSPSITPDPQPPAQPTPQPTTSNPANSTPPGNSATTNAPATSIPSAPAPTDSTPSADTPKSESDSPSPVASDKASPPADKDSTAKDDTSETPRPAKTSTERPKPAPKPPAPKPSAASSPAGYDPVSEARKYLYGRGAPQDCDRGLRLLKPAANQSNPKAMVEMGALYSAGLCTPHDLPTAYRWFALALRKDPENSAVQADLQKLWGEMTQPERQLAIKMTQ
jgi:hypothetical protein